MSYILHQVLRAKIVRYMNAYKFVLNIYYIKKFTIYYYWKSAANKTIINWQNVFLILKT